MPDTVRCRLVCSWPLVVAATCSACIRDVVLNLALCHNISLVYSLPHASFMMNDLVLGSLLLPTTMGPSLIKHVYQMKLPS
jgi:hypothetical protein